MRVIDTMQGHTLHNNKATNPWLIPESQYQSRHAGKVAFLTITQQMFACDRSYSQEFHISAHVFPTAINRWYYYPITRHEK